MCIRDRYEKDSQPLEVVVEHFIQTKFVRPKVRPYQTDNYYCLLYTSYDELQLDTLGDKKTALFLIMSDTDATFNFLISMIYTQLDVYKRQTESCFSSSYDEKMFCCFGRWTYWLTWQEK